MSYFEIDEAELATLSPEEQAEWRAKLERYQLLVESNPLWAYDPMPAQIEFHRARSPIKGIAGGNRAGKSHAGVMDDIIDCVDRDALPPWLEPFKRWDPPTYGRIVTPDFTRASEGVVVEKLRRLTPRAQLKGGSWKDAYDQRRRRLSFENGSWIDFLSGEQDLSSHAGQDLHFIHF